MMKGAAALSDSELIHLLIREGHEGSGVDEVSRKIMEICENNLLELGKRSVKDLMKVKGIGHAKAITLVAALELSRRWNMRQWAANNPVIRDSRQAEGYLRPLLEHLDKEEFGVIYLSQSGKVLREFERISSGGMTSTTVDPRLVFRKALDIGAVSIVIAHNHPSGSLRPSKADEALTQKIHQGAKILDIKLLDHIIIGHNGYFSFADHGLLN
jgi:DNA repair protein RadC